ncbi:MAG: hydrogenase accessory protein [Paracoccaceae bacterium]|nr:hydrogenase accessory protein [Paracoccaceae bacterium]
MSHPLISRLTADLGWPHLKTLETTGAFTSRPGVHCLFIPGDPGKNLETTDAAVILPELVQAFQGRFDCAVVDEAIDYEVREAAGVFKTPLLIFFRDGAQIGAIPRVRDWSDYLARVTHILSLEAEGAA